MRLTRCLSVAAIVCAVAVAAECATRPVRTRLPRTPAGKPARVPNATTMKGGKAPKGKDGPPASDKVEAGLPFRPE